MILSQLNRPRERYFFIAIILIAVILISGAVFFLLTYLRNEKAKEVKALEEASKKFVIERKNFGSSEKGKPIEGYVIGKGSEAALIFAAIHGNEMGTAGLLNQLVLEIALKEALVSPALKLVIIPIVNPDGYYDRTDNLNANGVNLNLNFGTSDWEKYGPEGNFAGLAPFSENESQILKQVIEQYKPSVMFSFHSHGNLVSPEENEVSRELAQWYSQKSGYKYFEEWDYPGTATKWFAETTGKVAITVEISKDLQTDWEINKKALLEFIALDPKVFFKTQPSLR
jgi:predicted deacylase